MKVCIYGAGAIGGYLGVQLARAGAVVSLVARGAHLAAMHKDGLKLLIDGEERVAHPSDPLVTVVQEIGRLLDVPTPTIDTVLTLVQQRATIAGLYKTADNIVLRGTAA